MSPGKNVLGGDLAMCCRDPITGFMRTGRCETGPDDHGLHVVCAQMTVEFLQFSLLRGNDLVTPHPEWEFPGLKPGDCWCICAARWQEALDAGVAPPVKLASTHMSALEFINMGDLLAHALDGRG